MCAGAGEQVSAGRARQLLLASAASKGPRAANRPYSSRMSQFQKSAPMTVAVTLTHVLITGLPSEEEDEKDLILAAAATHNTARLVMLHSRCDARRDDDVG